MNIFILYLLFIHSDRSDGSIRLQAADNSQNQGVVQLESPS